MRIFSSVLISIFMMIGFAGCTGTSVGCAIEGGADTLLAPAIAMGLQCSNQSAIETSLQEAGTKIGLCSPTATPTPASLIKPKGIVGDVCAALGNALVGSLASAAIPAAWGCNPASATAGLGMVITTVCGLIPLIQNPNTPPAS